MEDDAHAAAAAETQDLVALAERGAYELEVGVPILLGNCPPLGDPRVNGAATGRAVAFARVRWEGGVTDGTVINLCGGAFHVSERLDLRGQNAVMEWSPPNIIRVIRVRLRFLTDQLGFLGS